MIDSLLNKAIDFQNDAQNIFIRYEDIILNKDETASKLSEWLNLSNPLDASKVEEAAGHMTSKSPEASVEQWREELDDEVISYFETEFGEKLTKIGYTL